MHSKSFSFRRTLTGVLGVALLALGVMEQSSAAQAAERVNNVVLVHGGFVDGGGWEPVYKLLKAKGSTSASCRTRRRRLRQTWRRPRRCWTRRTAP